MERRIFHVRQTRNRWEVVKEGFRRPHFVQPNKEEAVRMAKRLAKSAGTGDVIIHRLSGDVERRFSYRSWYEHQENQDELQPASAEEALTVAGGRQPF